MMRAFVGKYSQMHCDGLGTEWLDAGKVDCKAEGERRGDVTIDGSQNVPLCTKSATIKRCTLKIPGEQFTIHMGVLV